MKTEEFKNKVKDLKEFLRGKEIVLGLVTSSGVQTFTFSTLKSFGSKVLELEMLGAGFSFVRVENDRTTRRMMSDKELAKWTKRGVWTKVHINAAILGN